MAVYDVSPYVDFHSGRSRPASSSPYPGSSSQYDRGSSEFDFGSALGSALRTSPFLQMFSPAALYNSFGPRFSGGASGTTRVSPRATEGADPYNVARRAAMSAAGLPRIASAEDYRSYLEGTAQGLPPGEATLPYIGGFPSNYVSRQHFGAQREYGRLEQDKPRDYAVTAFSRPLYPEGSEYAFFAKLGVSQIREWQNFFAGLGFKTGPAGVISQHDLAAMRAFMGMANGIPGGMKVDTLRDRVMDQVRAGVYFFRGVNENGDLLPALLGETPQGDLAGGGGGGAGAPEYTGPITETVTRNIVQEFSVDQSRLALRNIVAQQIGRAPTDEELRDFVRQVNAAFRSDPTIITQVTVTDPITGESDVDITEDETNVDPEGMALSFAEEVDPAERQEYQTGRYFDAIMSAIGM